MTQNPNGKKHLGTLVRLKGVSSYTDVRGKTRWRYRSRGKTFSLKGKPGSPEFMDSYNKAINGAPKKPTRVIPYSFRDLVSHYKTSQEFQALSKSTQTAYARLLSRLVSDFGDLDATVIEPSHIRSIRNKYGANAPTTGNRILSLMSILMNLACELEWIDRSPCRGVRKIKIKQTGGFHSWTDQEITQFKKFFAEGTKPRLALMLMLHTAQRGSDICRMGSQHVTKGVIRVAQQKTGETLYIPLTNALKQEIDRHPQSMVFITTKFGSPYKSAKAFQQWFSKCCSIAGLPHCSAHGLRKAGSRMLAEGGATSKELMAITGHKTLSQASEYIRAADQKRLAVAAIAILDGDKNG